MLFWFKNLAKSDIYPAVRGYYIGCFGISGVAIQIIGDACTDVQTQIYAHAGIIRHLILEHHTQIYPAICRTAQVVGNHFFLCFIVHVGDSLFGLHNAQCEPTFQSIGKFAVQSLINSPSITRGWILGVIANSYIIEQIRNQVLIIFVIRFGGVFEFFRSRVNVSFKSSHQVVTLLWAQWPIDLAVETP